MNAADVAYGEVRGFLEAFARLNDKTNFGCTFTFDALPDSESLQEALRAWFGDDVVELRASLVEDWQVKVRAILARWLFHFLNPSEDHLLDPRHSFCLSDDDARGSLIDWVMDALGRVVQPSAVWRINVVTKFFYECAWDDIVFESSGRSYLLHLGVTD